MSKKLMKLLSVVLTLAMCMCLLSACGGEEEPAVTPTEAPTEAPKTTEAPTEAPAAPTAEPTPEVKETLTPLVVGYSPFSQKFSPFYADTAYDQDVVGMTQLSVMTTDRMGGIIYNAIEGETVSYNGTDYLYTGPADIAVNYDESADQTVYTMKLRNDLKFSDGQPLTADDLIFTYYVLLDPTYVGSSTLSSYDIVGLKDYQTQTTSELYTKYKAVVDAIYAAGRDYVPTDADSFTADQAAAFWTAIDVAWAAHTGQIVSYVYNKYASYADQGMCGSYTSADLETEGIQIAFGMAMWGFGGFEDDGVTFTGACTGTQWNTANGEYPTLADYAAECKVAYGDDPDAYYATETVGNGEPDVLNTAKDICISKFAADEPELADGIPNISGITKINDYEVKVVVNGYSAPAVYSICGQQIVPLHYYGDASQYDYAANKFGHPFGDLSLVGAKTTSPMGAGPYKFVEYKDKVVYFEANENYWKGAPIIKYIQFKEVNAAEIATAVQTGTVDAGEMTGSKTRFAEVQSFNSNGDITGNVITTSKVDNLGYGYIGMNADTVNVAGEPASDASKNLRKGLATVLAVCRDTAIDSYYGEAASIIQYPISNTSWAAPQATDEGYAIAFSKDVNGNEIYTSAMSMEDKYAAALEACKGYLIAAGYTFDDATGKFTAAPDGAQLSYEVIIPGDGAGDHPSFAILTKVKELLDTIGIELVINDPADSNVLWDALDAGTQNLWCAAWGSTIDPDMYQVYHSSGIVGRGGSDSNHYHIADDELDSLIVEARTSDDQAFRKSVYKECLDLIVDWAVEIPVYQRQNCVIFSTERINIDTLTPDITTFWGWMNDIELLDMN